MTKLTVFNIQNAKPQAKPYKLYDEKGLYLLISPHACKSWRFKFYFADKEQQLGLGTYPETTLQQARDRRDEARSQIQAGINPCKARKEAKRALKAAESFKTVALEWHDKKKARWTDNGDQILAALNNHIFPVIGSIAIGEVTKRDVLDFIRRLEDEDKIETAKRLRRYVKEIFQYAIGTDRVEYNPAAAVDPTVLKEPTQKRHFACIGKEELPELMKKVKTYDGDRQTQLALRFLMLTFVRTKEMRMAEWREFDLDRAAWNVPAEHMKMRRPHFVPLSTQAVEILREIRTLTGESPYVFPNQARRKAPYMSENTVLFAFYRMGYRSRMTGHGVRALASTVLNERGFNPDAIERQLAHVETNEIRAAYNRGSYLEERTHMMQWWGDYLDGMIVGDKIIRVNFAEQRIAS
jgi:integrase